MIKIDAYTQVYFTRVYSSKIYNNIYKYFYSIECFNHFNSIKIEWFYSYIAKFSIKMQKKPKVYRTEKKIYICIEIVAS